MKTTTEVLRSLVADIDAMKAKSHWDKDDWFGGFDGRLGDDHKYYIEWPNLGILLKEAKQVLGEEEDG